MQRQRLNRRRQSKRGQLAALALCLLVATAAVLEQSADQQPAGVMTLDIPLPPAVQKTAAPDRNHAAIACLAETIYFEARGEDRRHQLAIGQVVINRVRSKRWPDDICGVVHQRTVFGDRRPPVCQFTWACDMHRSMNDRSAYAVAMDLAGQVYDQFYRTQTMPDIVGGATHFHNDSVHPIWADRLMMTARLDTHTFYAYPRHQPTRTRQ